MQKHPLWFGLVAKSPLEVSITPLINSCDNFSLALMDERNHVRVA